MIIAMNHNTLPDNHKRSLSSSLYVVEKLLSELEREISSPTNQSTIKVVGEIPPDEKERMLSVLKQAKDYIAFLTQKYQLRVNVLELSNILKAQKAKIWEVLCDSNSKGLKGYGQLEESIAKELDNDVTKLQELINQL